MNKGHTFFGETIAVSLANGSFGISDRLNTTVCAKLAAGAATGEVYCVGPVDAKVYGVHRVDFNKGIVSTVGTFGQGCNAIVNEVAAFDAQACSTRT